MQQLFLLSVKSNRSNNNKFLLIICCFFFGEYFKLNKIIKNLLDKTVKCRKFMPHYIKVFTKNVYLKKFTSRIALQLRKNKGWYWGKLKLYVYKYMSINLLVIEK